MANKFEFYRDFERKRKGIDKPRKKLIYITITMVVLNLTFISAIYISVSVPEKYTDVIAGEEFYFTFELKEPENLGRHDILLEYEIKKGDKTIAGKTETKAIETQASFIESLLMPKNAQSGIYSIVVTVNNRDSESAVFYVKKQINYFLIIIAIIIIGFFLTLLELYRIRKFAKK